ncbi:MAG: YaeQ family protein, partial [Nannocystaceae bacterium]|nr:YaeQ family protein [Nannocystaceae bacterium]
MALTATVHRFEIELADIDRGVYESLDLRVARHPSEDEARVVVRVLARAIAHEDGLEFGRGLSTVEDPALWTRTPTGEVATWIDVGLPSA